MAETHSEKRSSGLHLELIPMDKALQEEMVRADEASTVDTSPYEAGDEVCVDNFRPDNQKQDFFVSVSKRIFPDAENPLP